MTHPRPINFIRGFFIMGITQNVVTLLLFIVFFFLLRLEAVIFSHEFHLFSSEWRRYQNLPLFSDGKEHATYAYGLYAKNQKHLSSFLH